jgi:hypothetical protein
MGDGEISLDLIEDQAILLIYGIFWGDFFARGKSQILVHQVIPTLRLKEGPST